MLTRTMIICCLLLGIMLGVKAAGAGQQYLKIGDTWQTAVAILGTPTNAVKLEEGRVLLYYGKGEVTVQSGKVEKWRDFPPPPARAHASPLSSGASQADVLAALGWPPKASHAPQLDKSPIKEIWEYPKSSLTFLNGRLSGWVNAAESGIVLGKKMPGATLTLGSSRQEAIAAIGTPDTLELLSDENLVSWHVGADALTLQAGKVAAWENWDQALPLFPPPLKQAGTNSPALGAKQKDAIATMGLPLALELNGKYPSLWCYDQTALALDKAGQVSEIATPRLQAYMSSIKLGTDKWNKLIAWLLEQPHLDYHAELPLTRAMLYKNFLASNTEAAFYNKFRSDRGNALYTTLSHANHTHDYLAGAKAALDAAGKTVTPPKGHIIKDYTAGAAQMAQAFQQFMSDTFTQDLTTAKYVQLPDCSGKKSDAVKAMLTNLGVTVDTVLYRDPTYTGNVVTGCYPPVGDYLLPQGNVTLYIAQ